MKWIGCDRKQHGLLSGAIPAIEGPGKNQKKNFMNLVGDEAKIQSRHIPDAGHKSYSFSQLAQHISC
jgi:hypothetical protein